MSSDNYKNPSQEDLQLVLQFNQLYMFSMQMQSERVLEYKNHTVLTCYCSIYCKVQMYVWYAGYGWVFPSIQYEKKTIFLQ